MPSVSYDGQSFQFNGRRIWLCGASLPYALVPTQEWKPAIASIAEAGFNIVETSVPWLLHEPRPGRFDFKEGLDLRRFVELCGDAGLRVLLRAGPYIGGTIDGGGLPPWLAEIPGMAIRQGSEVFLERVGLFFHWLFEQVVELQATRAVPGGRDGGPLLLVQVEHAWHCANEEQGRKYLQELVRYVRECGITLPLLSANDLWQDVEGTIETWTGSHDLLVNLRQLRSVQSHAPRLVTSFNPCGFERWGEPAPTMPDGDEVMLKLAQIFAAGGQPFVAPFHPGANFGFLGGRLPGPTDRYACTRAAIGAPLDEAGRRGATYARIKRLASFATAFGHVFAELDPDYHPIAVDVESLMPGARPHERGKARSAARRRADGAARAGAPPADLSVVPLQGPQGRIVFVFAAEGGPRNVTLLLENGIRMPVALGDQPVGWYVLDVDLLGNGHLDFCNLCPTMLVDRSILVVQGPARAQGYLSINGGPLDATVPSGFGAPLVVDHKGITVVICNQEQIDATFHDQEHVFVGCAGFDAGGRPILAPGFAKVWRIGKGGECKPAPFSAPAAPARAPALGAWSHATSAEFASGASARFATLDGPASLNQCGARHGYGWYRLRLRSGPKKRLLHVMEGGDRLHVYADGELHRIVGNGPAAQPGPFDVKPDAEGVVAILADNLGRFADGNDAGERKGIASSVFELAPVRGVKARRVEAAPADPFKLRAFIIKRAAGQLGGTSQVQWTFNWRKKTPLLVHLRGLRTSGTLVLNGTPLAYYSGECGSMQGSVVIDPATSKSFKPGANALRFSPDPGPQAPDARAEDPSRLLALYEIVRDLGRDAQWGFARWEAPAARHFQGDGKPPRGVPAWWRCSFTTANPSPLWLTTNGLSKGVALLNGRAIGRYFSASSTGRPVGPQTSLYIPAPWLRTDAPNELFIFDEHGFAPTQVRLSNDAPELKHA
ncbi:MAG: beta-galactosidase [Phycisphaerales bacterium]